MSKALLFGISVRLLGAWLVFAILGFVFGKQLVTLLIPFFSWVINLFQDDYRAVLQITGAHDELISMSAITQRGIPPFANKGAKLTAGANVAHVLVPMVLLFTALTAWPARQFTQRIHLLLAGIPLVFILAALTLPFQLMGSLEIMFQNMADEYRVNRDKPLFLNWMLFLEVGGRWALPIAMAVFTGFFLQQSWLDPQIKKPAKRSNKHSGK